MNLLGLIPIVGMINMIDESNSFDYKHVLILNIFLEVMSLFNDLQECKGALTINITLLQSFFRRLCHFQGLTKLARGAFSFQKNA